LLSFGISKPLASSPIWLTQARPFVTWGPEPEAARYATAEEAWRAIASLPGRDGDGAAVHRLRRAPSGTE